MACTQAPFMIILPLSKNPLVAQAAFLFLNVGLTNRRAQHDPVQFVQTASLRLFTARTKSYVRKPAAPPFSLQRGDFDSHFAPLASIYMAKIGPPFTARKRPIQSCELPNNLVGIH